MEDAEILALFFARSEQAVEALADKYGSMLRRLAENILPDGRDAEECVSDAYLAVWNAVPPARPEVLSAYVCRIVRNKALDRLRAGAAARRSAALTALEELEEILPGPETPESRLDCLELGEGINRFLSGLDSRDRVLFLRRYWYGDGVEAAGAALGLSAGQAGLRLFRLRKKLRRYLEKEGYTI